RIPKKFSTRNAASKKDLASALRNRLAQKGESDKPGRPAKIRSRAADDEKLHQLRKKMRAHPCHGCDEREDHARWSERWARSKREYARLLKRIEGRSASIARYFDNICGVLIALGYLTLEEEKTTVTDEGRWLAKVYAEKDLTVAECLRRSEERRVGKA